ncbi:MAG TPA: hypothetical protein ENJ95_15680 [Bacteroidetes bacterium]|nr:hypothetical protein [Bacteroidota bacterium]
MKRNFIKQKIESKIDTIKQSRSSDSYSHSLYFTLNFKSEQVTEHKTLSAAKSMNFDYLLVLSYFKYEYFHYTNYSMKLVCILDSTFSFTETISINDWSMSIAYDGSEGSTKENCFLGFNLIDKIRKKSTVYRWKFSYASYRSEGLSKLLKITKNYFTMKEYEQHLKIIELENIIKNLEEEEE